VTGVRRIGFAEVVGTGALLVVAGTFWTDVGRSLATATGDEVVGSFVAGELPLTGRVAGASAEVEMPFVPGERAMTLLSTSGVCVGCGCPVTAAVVGTGVDPGWTIEVAAAIPPFTSAAAEVATACVENAVPRDKAYGGSKNPKLPPQ
jgi:hypothetical protein